jgi:serine/threonine protein kinase
LCTKYIELEECVGEGGFGAVYKVKESGGDRRYILKKLEMQDLNDLEKV